MSDPTVLVAIISGGSLITSSVIAAVVARSGTGRDQVVAEILRETKAENRRLRQEHGEYGPDEFDEEDDEPVPPPRHRRRHRGS